MAAAAATREKPECEACSINDVCPAAFEAESWAAKGPRPAPAAKATSKPQGQAAKKAKRRPEPGRRLGSRCPFLASCPLRGDPVVLVTSSFGSPVAQRASDIHLEPKHDMMHVRLRSTDRSSTYSPSRSRSRDVSRA